MLAPQATITSVTIASPPVVKFTVKDAAGSPVVGLGNRSQPSTATVSSLTNIGFTLAKLVPGTNGAPSKWVNYLMVRPPTVAEKTATPATSSCDAATNATWCGTYPTYDREGTLIDFGDGSYQYTFYRNPKDAATIAASLTDTANGLSMKADFGDLSYDPTLTHRLGIQIGGTAPGTGTNLVDSTTLAPVSGAPAAVSMVTPANVLHDFRPDGATVTSTRDIVTMDSCTECHAGKVLNHGSRKDPNYCATCHTDQIKYSFDQGEAPMSADGLTFAVQTGTNAVVRPAQAIVGGRAVGNLPNMIHKIHMGELLVKQGYNWNNDDLGLFNEVRFPQDIRNCTKCHDGSANAVHKTADGDNWKNVPSRLACGACHDGINFATGGGVTLADAAKGLTSTTTFGGKAHGGGAQAGDSLCALCHTPASIDISASHIPVTPPDESNGLLVANGSLFTNAAAIAGNHDNLPAGAIKATYDIKSVSRNASKQPVMVFRLLQNGTRKDLNDPLAKTEVWDNFFGAPSVYFVYAVPQDGITAPADFNAALSSNLKYLWNGTAAGTRAGTLSAPDADGYYTVTFTGVVVPDNAVMLTGGLGYDYYLNDIPAYGIPASPPLTQTNLADYPVAASPVDATKKTGGLIVSAPDVTMVATGYSGRRAIVETARCEKCHEKLGVFTDASFHGGQRNDATSCSWCHNPNRTSSGWSADSTSYIHAIHAADKRSVPFNWHATSAENFSGIGYPGVLKKCETCHLPGTYDFSASASSAALPNRLYRTVATGAGFTTAAAATSFSFAPADLVPRDLNYGSGFSVAAATGVPTDAAGTTLVNSPIAAACFACHDGNMVSNPSQTVRNHIETLGYGSIYKDRTTALGRQEACILCHGPNSGIAPIAAMHAK